MAANNNFFGLFGEHRLAGKGILNTLLLCALLAVSACNPLLGFVESEFSLAVDSRLPKWLTLPQGNSRDDVSISITFYSSNKVRFTVKGPAPERKLLIEKIGAFRWHPVTKQKGYSVYPLYAIISVDGVEETFAQMKPEPFLYVVDKH